ncbi:hypothetical protein [Rheinheimera sp. 1928-s]|uniref:hypothetical protein n=1 Tax=Rheinheimera sp. 1928-s TaxID=3033803 RepID=UPI0026169337|nr:hypothetical protein [Rheinheimera sp. 1928-s]MDF3126193.1 hypothetical protein [Rheinheimera sp. 1928-s]
MRSIPRTENWLAALIFVLYRLVMNKKDPQVSMAVGADFQLQQMIDIFLFKAVKSGLAFI